MNVKLLKYPLIPILALGLISCGVVTKNYQQPEINDQQLFRAPATGDTITIADAPWKTFFKDPYLQKLISEGIDGNYNLQRTLTQVAASEAVLKQSRAAFFPNVSVGPSVTLSRADDIQSFGKKKNNQIYELSANASWELDLWGKLTSQKRASYANFLQTEAYRRLVFTSLISNIAANYYSLIALDKQLEITLGTIILLEENVDTMKALMNAGIVTGAAVEQSKSLLYATQVSVPDLRNNIAQMENNISALLGKNPGIIERSTMDLQGIPAQLEYGIPSQLLSRRPDVEQAELAFRSAFEGSNIARASLYPTLTISGNTGFNTYNTLDNFFDSASFFGNIIGGLTQPIFNGRRLRTNLEISKAQEAEAFLTFKETVLNAGVEVSNALSSFESAKSKTDIRNLQIESLQKSTEFTKELVKYGNANYTEVLTAEQNLLSSQLSQVNDQLQQLQSAINLYRALGGGVK